MPFFFVLEYNLDSATEKSVCGIHMFVGPAAGAVWLWLSFAGDDERRKDSEGTFSEYQ